MTEIKRPSRTGRKRTMAEAKGIEQRPNAEQKGPPMVSCKTRGIVVRERIIVGRRGRLSKEDPVLYKLQSRVDHPGSTGAEQY